MGLPATLGQHEVVLPLPLRLRCSAAVIGLASAVGAMLDAIFTYGGLTIRVCTTATRWSLPMEGICATW